MKVPSRETFYEFLFGVCNIAPEPAVEPGSRRGRIINSTALATAKLLYDLIEKSSAHREGVLCTVRLLVESTCARDPEGYAKQETRRGLDGERHDDVGACIELPMEKNLNCGTIKYRENILLPPQERYTPTLLPTKKDRFYLVFPISRGIQPIRVFIA